MALARADTLAVAFLMPQEFAIQQDLAVAYVLKRHQNPQDGRLARPAGPDQRELLARLDVHVQVIEHPEAAE